MNKWPVVFALMVGAALGTTVGAIFDRLRDPGAITLYGGALGIVFGLATLLRLRAGKLERHR